MGRANNLNRMGEAVDEDNEGEPLKLYAAFNEQDEAVYRRHRSELYQRRQQPLGRMYCIAQRSVPCLKSLFARPDSCSFMAASDYERAEIKNACVICA